MMTREEAEQAARAAEAAREEAARRRRRTRSRRKGTEKTSLYASQKPMSQKAKCRKGTRSAGVALSRLPELGGELPFFSSL